MQQSSLIEAPEAVGGAQTLILDGYPSTAQAQLLGPNNGTRRWGVAKERAAIHERVAVEVLAQGVRPVAPPVVVTFTYVVPTRAARDWDNYALIAKPVQDGLVKAGILAGDHFEMLTGIVRFRVEKRQRRLEIRLEPAA